MAKEPKIGKFLDRDEEELFRTIEADSYGFGQGALTAGRKTELQAAARNTLNDERVQITLRISKYNLAKIKARALREGMPYQTMINSILHKAVG